MSRLTRDPELDQLVRTINERAPEATDRRSNEPAPHAWPPADVPEGNPMQALLLEMSRRGASDLLLMAGAPPVFRADGRLLGDEAAPFEADEMPRLFASLLTSRVRERMDT